MSNVIKFQDDVTLVLRAQKVIVHETVRVNVNIKAQVENETNEADFRQAVQATLKSFIDTEWKIQNVHRSKGSSRYEDVFVQATARVSEKENHQLQERAAKLSRIGFEVINPSVDYNLTFDEIDQVNRELRLELFRQVLTETNEINKVFAELAQGSPKSHFRVSSTRFADGSEQESASNRFLNAPVHAMMATAAPLIRDMAMPYSGNAIGSGASNYDDEDEFFDMEDADEGSADLNVSTRFTMVGTFILRHQMAE
jgi:hypothetical protein